MAAQNHGALHGVKIVDLSRVLSGPFCTQILADHGADVIKVESPDGDEVRRWGPPFKHGMASYFIGVNRNKHSIGVDLSRQPGRDALVRLLDGADVLLENFKPGTMEKWGLGYGQLSDRFPSLIYCRISGFGAEGPLGGFPGYDAILQAMCGLMSVNGDPQARGVRLGIPIVDIASGLYTAIAIVMGLVERSRSGLGQFIDMTLYDSALAILHPYLANYLLSGERPVSTGNAHPNISPYDKFPTRTCEIFLGIGNDRAFQRLCAELQHPHLAEDERFRSNADRVRNKQPLREILENVLSQYDGHALCRQLLSLGLAAGPVASVDEAFTHAHTRFRNMAIEEDWYRGVASPVKFSRSKGVGLVCPPPELGQNGRQILLQHGYSDAEINALVADGVICGIASS